MKRFIRVLAIPLMLCLLFSACCEAAGNSNNGVVVTTSLDGKTSLVGNIKCEFPLVNEETFLNYLVTGYGNTAADNVYVWNKYEEMTGVSINWTTTAKSEREEAVYTALINKTDLDLIMRCKIGSEKLTQYGESGLILDLAKDGMLQENAPNCWAYLQSHPDALASVMNPDGTIYALPQVNSGAELRVARKIFINKRWLDNVHMQVPTTTKELYQVLKAFKEQDANANGNPDDEIPLSSPDWQSIQEAFYGAFGLGNRGLHNSTVDMDEETGKVRLIAQSDGYKAFLEYFRRLYSEGLLDKYMFTMTADQWVNNAANDLVGVFASTNLAGLPSDKTDNWVAVEQALEGPDGDKLWSAVRANFHSTGAAVIPSTCDNPELVLKWLDYFWTDEGTLFYHMGIEDTTFVSKDDGTYDYMPFIYDEMKAENKSFDDVVAKYTPYPGGSNPTVEIAPYFMGGEMADVPASAARKLFEYGPKEYWPSFTFTTKENERLGAVQSDINKYCSSMRVDFITGIKSLSQWNNYTAQLDRLGAADMLKIYQLAVDRYYALTNSQ